MLARTGRRARAALLTATAVGAVVTLTPASGAAGDIATGFVRAVRHLAGPSRDVTGADRLAAGSPPGREQVRVIGYPDAADQPVTCQNRLGEPMAGQLEFDCDGYTAGTSGGPFLSEVDQATGQGLVIGVIGGYQQGGDTPDVSYSPVLGPDAAALYQKAVAAG